MKNKLLSIHYLRGLAALFVVLFHYRRTLNDVYVQKDLGDIFFNGAFFGVDLFFMISGFVMVYSTKSDSRIISFVLKRFFKIYPVYIFCLLSWLALHLSNLPPLIDIVKSISFIHLNYNSTAPWFGGSIVGTAWTLTYEILFYIIFLVAMQLSQKHRTLICSILIASIFVLINYYFSGNIGFGTHEKLNYQGTASFILKPLASPLMLEFIYGMITCEIYLKLNTEETYKKASDIPRVFLLSSLAIMALMVSKGNIDHGPMNIGIPCLLVLLSAVIYEKYFGLKERKTLQFFADISYPLYLVHLLVSSYMYEIKNLFPFYASLHGFTRMLFLMIISISLSYIIHLLIEVPSSNLARKLLPKRS